MISIVIPTYNREKEIKKCIESILPQYYPGLEVIVVDDFSTDATNAYLQALHEEYKYISVIRNSRNFGVNYTRNRGIELASQKFILFLDSDDQLAAGGLQKIRLELETHQQTKHFLFLVSDRKAEFEQLSTNRYIQYEAWIKEKVGGDFTHVVAADILKRNLFFEQFRMYENLNWLRIKKETSPQLLVPIVVTERDRGRADSLTVASKLSSLAVIDSKFESNKMYYSLYHNDLRLFQARSLTYPLLETILLGVACNKKAECKKLIRYSNKWHIKFLGHIIATFPTPLIKAGIINYSNLKGA